MFLNYVVAVIFLTQQHEWLVDGSYCNLGSTMENRYTAHKRYPCQSPKVIDVSTPKHNHVFVTTDIAVATEATVDFMSSDGDVSFSMPQQFSDLTAVAYDPVRRHLYMTDSENESASIFRYDIVTREITPLKVPKQKRDVQGIAYDQNTETLYWTNGHGRTISTMKANSDAPPATLLSFNNSEILSGIAVDNCRGVLYWTNSNHLDPSIESSSLDGTNHKVIIKDDIFQPLGIAVDFRHLYWSDDREGIYFRIERSNLDGTARTTLVSKTYHLPFALSVGPEFIFWSDLTSNAVWRAPKRGHSHEPKMIRKYTPYDSPMGVVSSRLPSCQDEPETSSEADFQNDDSTTAMHTSPSGCESSNGYCLNGFYDAETRRCVCSAGFKGSRCEVQSCFNYCIHGACYLDTAGNPQCPVCDPGYAGDRCHVDVCEGYCLNGGNCSVVNGKPECACSRHSGWHCETPDGLVQYEVAYNASMASESKLTCVNGELRQIVLAVMGCVMVVMTVVIVFLARNVCLLRKRPRIKKHIIVQKNVRPTPLTSRPPNQGEQCEITIENCCNMNICETPCFEPQLRTSKSQSKTEEKKNLLSSMEESSNCLPTQDDLY